MAILARQVGAALLRRVARARGFSALRCRLSTPHTNPQPLKPQLGWYGLNAECGDPTGVTRVKDTHLPVKGPLPLGIDLP